MGWNYKGVSQEKMQKRAEMKDSRYGSGARKGYLDNELYKSFIPRDGQNKLRIVPPLEVEQLEWYGMEVRFHRNVGLAKDYYLCLLRMGLGPCPICELQTKELWDEDADLAKTYYPDHRVLVWVCDLMADNPYKEVLLWSCPIGLAYDIHNVAQDKETGRFIDIMDPVKGAAVFFAREGKGLRTKYTGVQVGRSAVPLPDSVASQLKPFADLLVVPEYDEVKAAMDYTAAATWDKKAEDKPKSDETPAAWEPDSRAEPEQEAESVGRTLLDGMSRDELKAFKVKHKAEIKELQFTIQAAWSDSVLKEKLLAALAVANRMDLVVESEPEQEAEQEAAPDMSSHEAEIARKKEEVRQKLAAVMAGKKK